MNERRDIRVSDKDRAAAVERLRAAHDEGRLSLLEYDDRISRAYQAVTYRDLDELFTDLPDDLSPAAPVLAAQPSPARPAAPATAAAGAVHALPTWLRILWTIWVTVVGINVVIWALVSASNADLHYFWPMWVAGPTGALLLGLSAGAAAVRRNRRPPAAAPPKLPSSRPPRIPRTRAPRNRRPSR